MTRRMVKPILSVVVFLVVIVVGVSYGVTNLFDRAVMEMKTGRYEPARSKLEALAMVGHKQAKYLLGQIYAYGWGISRNRDEALKWFRQAAYHGEGLQDPAAYAAHYVGQNYAEGIGVRQDTLEADFWFKFAEQGGYTGDSAGK
ncbi:hypothetical protein [Thiobacillus sp.]|uniref:tetratricopeptide repeat protein n=1 Tax=Thiobacillus sp. TaxID=924 RepID=UPI0025FC4261|nr:hypothetical protein [Thiobacillus sp.]MBT9539681.1 sel1 repeat family protein [Thiobacillus sp.]